MNLFKMIQKPIKIAVFIVLLLSVSGVYAQQFNSDNYLTMPKGTGRTG